MRLVILGLSLALAGSAPLGFAAAQSPVSIQPLAAGEVLLEVNALGSVSSRADFANLSITINGEGDTEAAARAATETKIRESRAALRTLGIADADIRVRPVTTNMNPPPPPMSAISGMSDTNAMSEDMNMAMPMEEAPPHAAASGQAVMEVVVRNVDRVMPVMQALMARGVYSPRPGLGPTYELADASAARRAARAQAMTKARADAEAYAASLNMRVVRIVRITERIGLDGLSLFISEANSLTRLFAGQIMSGPEVMTVAAVGVDFALAPR